MPDITLTFPTQLNVSVAVGDTAYFTSKTTSGGFTTNSGTMVQMGTITSVNFKTNTIVVDTNLSSTAVTTNHFILFSPFLFNIQLI